MVEAYAHLVTAIYLFGLLPDDQQIIQQDVDKDDSTNNSVGQVKTELKTIDLA